ncbi:MAG: hypothetical protein JSV80_09375, partial [Acidobacteriota bacterium]
MGKVIKYLIVLAFLAAAAIGTYAWLQRRAPEEAGFKLVEVSQGSITEKALAIGQIEPRLKFRVKSKIGGIVKRCLVSVGDRVRPGDALFEIVPDPTPTELVEAQREVEAAEVSFQLAESELRRKSQLFAQKILARTSLDMAEEEYDRARIQLERAEDRLALIKEGKLHRADGRGLESTIRALEGGIVLQRMVDPGDPVVPLTS